MVYAGPIFWDQSQAREIMRWYRDFLPKAPPELCAFFGLKTVPSTAPFPQEIWGRRICALISCYAGTQADGEVTMQPVRTALPAPLLDWMSQMPFPALQGLFDPLLPKGLQWYWKGDFVRVLTDAAIEEHLRQRLGELFALDYDLLLYDVTSMYFEGLAARNTLAARGYSRDHRPDCKQVCIALVVTRGGIPLGYELFAGNRTDVTTVEEIVTTIDARYGLANRIWVMDQGRPEAAYGRPS